MLDGGADSGAKSSYALQAPCLALAMPAHHLTVSLHRTIHHRLDEIEIGWRIYHNMLTSTHITHSPILTLITIDPQPPTWAGSIVV